MPHPARQAQALHGLDICYGHRMCCDRSASHHSTGWSAVSMGLKRLGSRVAPKHGEQVIMACAPTCAFSLISYSFFLYTIAKFNTHL